MEKGHFITGQEISQLFGKLVGIWILQLCRENKFHNINLLELGPDKNTLMKDALRIDYGKNDPYSDTLQSVFKNQKRNLLFGYERLIFKRQMSDIFKVNCFCNKNLVVPIFKL